MYFIYIYIYILRDNTLRTHETTSTIYLALKNDKTPGDSTRITPQTSVGKLLGVELRHQTKYATNSRHSLSRPSILHVVTGFGNHAQKECRQHFAAINCKQILNQTNFFGKRLCGLVAL